MLLPALVGNLRVHRSLLDGSVLPRQKKQQGSMFDTACILLTGAVSFTNHQFLKDHPFQTSC
jgi:hypothetical protein